MKDAPLDGRMAAADRVVGQYCTPLGGPRASARALRAALHAIAERERPDPEGQFRVDDSEDPTTAGEILDDLKAYARDDSLKRYARVSSAHCAQIPGAIRRSRAQARAG